MHRRRWIVRQFGLLAVAGALGAPAAAEAAPVAPDEALTAYTTTVDDDGAAQLAELGVDLEHVGFRPGGPPERLVVDLFPSQAAELERDGVDLTERVVATVASPGTRRQASRGALTTKPDTGGDSPNPFYDVFRSYSEPGGVLDEMRALAREHPGFVKLVTIGTSGRGKPIVALKVTEDARNVADGSRPSVLYSAINHAREWIAAEVGRRLPRWFIEHRGDPRVADLLRRSELWFLPIMNPDGYDYTFTCGIGDGTAENRPCGSTLNPATGRYEYRDAVGAVQASSNRLWRKTLRDNDGNGVFGNSLDGVDPNRNYPTAWNLDEEGASNNPQSGVYRGPTPLSEPENLAYDRLMRRVGIDGVINYHSAAQLLLYPFGYITDVSPDDAPWFIGLTGTDGDAAVDPYISQRSSDLYITNGETTDHVYNKYTAPAWTPELDECQTAGGGQFCNSGFTFPDDEGKVRAVFDKNLDFARNVAATVTDTERPDRPRNFDDNPSGYQVKQTPDIEANRFAVSYGREQVLEANVRRVLGPVDADVRVAANGTLPARRIVVRMDDWAGGERFGDLRGRYYRRVRATLPADFVQPGLVLAPDAPAGDPARPRPLVAGDVVEVSIRAGGQQQRFSYRVQSVRGEGDARRVLVVAAEDYTGISPNAAPYDDAPRYADEYRTALEAAGYTAEVYDTDAPPAGAEGTPAAKVPSNLGVLDHFDAVVYETGDDLVPQDLTETVAPGQHRRAVGDAPAGNPPQAGQPDNRYRATTFTGSTHVARYGPRTWQSIRDYLNEGGKVVYAGRNLWTPQTSTSFGLTQYSGYTWWQESVFGFAYPAAQGGDDDRPGTAFFRELDVSNDFGQWFLGVAARRGGPFTSQLDLSTAQPPATGSIFAGLAPFTIDAGTSAGGGLDPTQDEDGTATPVTKTPHKLVSISALLGAAQKEFRREEVALEYPGADSTPAPSQAPGGAALATRDAVTFGFGLEQVAPGVRQDLLARSLTHLLPAQADTTAPTASVARPVQDGAAVTPRDPVELEVDAVDERGDLREVRLSVDGQVVARKRSFPHQLRWTPAPGDVGTAKELVFVAEDAAGNTTRVTRTVNVVASEAVIEAPVPNGRPGISGPATVGSTLTCSPGGFDNAPTQLAYEWLRNGVPIPGATGAGHTLTADDLGRTVACRVTATNLAGSADATSEGLVVSAAAAGPRGPAGPAGPQGPRVPPVTGTAPRITVSCRLVSRRRAIRCTVRQSSRATMRASVRLQNTRRAVARSGRGTVTVTLSTSRRLRSTVKAVVTVRSGGRSTRAVVRAGRSGTTR